MLLQINLKKDVPSLIVSECRNRSNSVSIWWLIPLIENGDNVRGPLTVYTKNLATNEIKQ